MRWGCGGGGMYSPPLFCHMLIRSKVQSYAFVCSLILAKHFLVFMWIYAVANLLSFPVGGDRRTRRKPENTEETGEHGANPRLKISDSSILTLNRF